MKELRIRDLDTGELVSYGRIALKRDLDLGLYRAWLTYSDSEQLWWIVVECDGEKIEAFGYTPRRLKLASTTFLELTEEQIAGLACAAVPS